MSSGFVYHLVPEKIIGNTLYPLNRLKEIDRDLYATHEAKYAGRSDLMKRPVPQLDCLWNDVLMFSPVAPDKIRQALIDAGHIREKRKWFVVPVSLLEREKSVFDIPMPVKPADLSLAFEDDYQWFSQDLLARYSEVPTLTHDYYKSVPSGEPVFFFQFIPHLLYRGTLNIDSLSQIEV